jgi:hypothetical protein
VELDPNTTATLLRRPDIKIDATNASYQDTRTFCAFLEFAISRMKKLKIVPTEKRPYLLFADGHKTRPTLQSLELCIKLHLKLFLYPPHSTTIYKPLDQIFQVFHNDCTICKADWRKSRTTVVEGTRPKHIPIASQATIGLMIEVITYRRWSAYAQCGFFASGANLSKININKFMPDVNDPPDVSIHRCNRGG